MQKVKSSLTTEDEAESRRSSGYSAEHASWEATDPGSILGVAIFSG